jgi:hypothetical protein
MGLGLIFFLGRRSKALISIMLPSLGWPDGAVFFSLIKGDNYICWDDDGTDLPSDDDARIYAERIIRELKADREGGPELSSLVVQSSQGATVLVLPFN